ncbi:MAG: helix-turn-helix transcriptional regulator [Clostridia bacterium]|nr:helix-turn-helix transcriptional regulator [Clostridia bacterium]
MSKYQSVLRDLRIDHDLTQAEVANALGTSQTMYGRYERGASEIPVRHLIKLAKLYNVSVDYILGLSKKKKKK